LQNGGIQESLMAENVQVSCITKRGGHYNPHERIQDLGGFHNGKPWKMAEDKIIAELEKPSATRSWNFYTSVNGRSAWVVVAQHNGRKYLKTEADGYSPDNLLALGDCSA
jgi:Protein of unknown function (DUF3892)